MITKDKKKKGAPTIPLTPEQRSDKQQLKRMKGRAAILSIESLTNHMFKVWGGERVHIVRITSEGITCDCEGWKNARNHNCSHVMKYRLVYGDLKK